MRRRAIEAAWSILQSSCFGMHETLLAQPALLNHYRERFKVILVDEFQDTNAIQYAWLRVLTRTCR